MKYTISPMFGVGEIKSENDDFYQVYFEDIDEMKDFVMKAHATTYDSYEAAENALNGVEESEAVKEIEDKKEFDTLIIEGTKAADDLEQQRIKNQKLNTPSSLRR